MAYVQIPGVGMWLPRLPDYIAPPITFTSMIIDATGEKAAFTGSVWFAERTGTKDITRVGFCFGAVTKAGGSGLTTSLQDVSPTGGPPGQPDEVQDQTAAIANGDANFASNTWCRTAVLSANRTVSFGELLSVVVEYDGNGRQGADSVALRGIGVAGTSQQFSVTGSVLKTASWAAQSIIPNVVLEFTDGSFGTLFGAYPTSAVGNTNVNTGSNPDEVALRINLPFPFKIEGVTGSMFPTTGAANFDWVLYEGTTPVSGGTQSVDGNAVISTGAARITFVPFDGELTCAKDTTYYLALKPTTANNVTQYHIDVDDNAHFKAHSGGAGFYWAQRADAGSWTETNTRRPLITAVLSSFDDAAGGSGLMVHPGMSGGMRG